MFVCLNNIAIYSVGDVTEVHTETQPQIYFIFFFISRFASCIRSSYSRVNDIFGINDQYLFLLTSMTSLSLFIMSGKFLKTWCVPTGCSLARSLVGFHWWMKYSSERLWPLWLKWRFPTSRSPNLIPLEIPPKLVNWIPFWARKLVTSIVSGSWELST